MNIRKSAFLVAFVLAGVCAFAEGTRTWEQARFEQFEKGTAKGVAIRSDGTLELAPAFKALTTTPSTYIWSMAADAQGNVYLAAGAPARVYRVTPDGKSTVILEPQELQVQALAVDKNGAVYAATSPDGKVSRIEHRGGKLATAAAAGDSADGKKNGVDPAWTPSVFFDPKTKYIWDLAVDREGRLYVATGDKGEVFRVNRNGEGAVFFKSDEAHIRVLEFDGKGNLIAGSDGSGLIYRISPQGEAFVLYSAPKKEITALAVDDKGNIFAAGVGEKRAAGERGVPGVTSTITAPPSTPPAPQQPGSITVTGPGAQLPPPILNLPLPAIGATGSEVYQIAPDGSPKRIWNSRDDIVYALGFDTRGRLLAGTGNKGRIVTIISEDEFTDLLKASATQVTGFARAPHDGLYVATSNLGKVFLMGGAPEIEGTYESDVFDARIFSRWGRAHVRGTGTCELWARSGNVDNPDRNWSPWKKVDFEKGAALTVPPARFIQWKAVLRPGEPAARINSVLVNYLPKNVAPVVEDVYVQLGARFNSVARASGSPETVSVGPAQGASPANPRFDAGPSAVRDRDSIAVRWVAHDENDDQLVYSLYYRGDNETRWKLLKDRLTDKAYSFDAGLLPDGGYTIKVVASDAPSHSPDEALTDERESARFEVDTTPPRIDDLNAAVEGTALRVTFRASDSFSVIKRAEYSVDAGEWQFVEPVGGLSDAQAENYDFSVPLPESGTKPTDGTAPAPAVKGKGGAAQSAARPAAGEHLVVVRVWDRFDNVATAKAVIHTH